MDLTLPDGASLGDEGHISDHNMIVTAIQSLNTGKVETLTVGTVTTVESDVEAQASLTQTGPGSYSLSLVIPRGSRGDLGLTGATGAQGDPGIGMPTGGSTGQYIKKNSNANYDYTFGTPTASEVGAVPTSRLVSAGTGLTGGGALTTDRTLSVSYGTTSGTSLEGTQLGKPIGATGAASATRYVGGTLSGPPVTGSFSAGDFIVAHDGVTWICTASGSPGSWFSSTASAVLWSADPAIRPVSDPDVWVWFRCSTQPTAWLTGDVWFNPDAGTITPN